MKPFINSKLALKPINSRAIKYGQQNEDAAIKSYVEYQNSQVHEISVHKCGLCIDQPIPWLAATPDGIVKFNQNEKYLEVQHKQVDVLPSKNQALCVS